MNTYDVLVVLGLFMSGLLIGRWLEARRWRANASTYIRIESGGKLYKVDHA